MKARIVAADSKPFLFTNSRNGSTIASCNVFGGLGSVVWLRGWDVFGTFHGILGLFVIAFFGAAAVLGRRIETGRSQDFDTHARLAGVAILLSAIAAVAGFVLLP